MEQATITIKKIVSGIEFSGNNIYIGRKNKKHGVERSPLANRFPIAGSTREESVAKYRLWLWDQIVDEDKAVLGELSRIWQMSQRVEEINLYCYCAPLLCHGEIIRSCLEWMDENSGLQAY